jgi:hypothetical protein
MNQFPTGEQIANGCAESPPDEVLRAAGLVAEADGLSVVIGAACVTLLEGTEAE